MKAIGNRLGNFKPQSRDKDETTVSPFLYQSSHPTNMRTMTYLAYNKPFARRGFRDSRTETRDLITLTSNLRP
ncbi:hypothetical protein TNCV_2531721 [Trichonephila clavipes]|nr:hypothetical protein TNCV_2531721 [Trichonephila clavipes]